jgi:hypothetical protein
MYGKILIAANPAINGGPPWPAEAAQQLPRGSEPSDPGHPGRSTPRAPIFEEEGAAIRKADRRRDLHPTRMTPAGPPPASSRNGERCSWRAARRTSPATTQRGRRRAFSSAAYNCPRGNRECVPSAAFSQWTALASPPRRAIGCGPTFSSPSAPTSLPPAPGRHNALRRIILFVVGALRPRQAPPVVSPSHLRRGSRKCNAAASPNLAAHQDVGEELFGTAGSAPQGSVDGLSTPAASRLPARRSLFCAGLLVWAASCSTL